MTNSQKRMANREQPISRIMGNLKKELTKMGVTDNVLRSRMLEFVKQEGKHLSSEQILSLLQDFIAHRLRMKAQERWNCPKSMRACTST